MAAKRLPSAPPEPTTPHENVQRWCEDEQRWRPVSDFNADGTLKVPPKKTLLPAKEQTL